MYRTKINLTVQSLLLIALLSAGAGSASAYYFYRSNIPVKYE